MRPSRRAKPWVPTIDFSTAPTVFKFLRSHAFFRAITGPVGSGKTHGCCIDPYVKACEQRPSPRDGYRYFKVAVVRNTMPELKRTTLETWRAMYPEDRTGPFRETTPVSHEIKIAPIGWEPEVPFEENPGQPGMFFQADFFAMDNPIEKKALLSYECTMFYFNEIREIEPAIVEMATTRAGRYPSVAKCGVDASWFGVIGDTNPTDGDEHWLNKLAVQRPQGYEFYRQPPAVLEMVKTVFGYRAKDVRYQHHEVYNEKEVTQAAGRLWAVNPKAENLKNLPVINPYGRELTATEKVDLQTKPGGYYINLIIAKDLAFIQSYAQGMDVYVREGRPVIPEFNEEVHVVDELPLLPNVPVEGGFDIGGGTIHPACVFGQKDPSSGLYLCHGEVSISEIGLERFGRECVTRIQELFPGYPFDKFWSDPAGRQRDPILLIVAFEYLKAKGLPAYPTTTNDPQVRIEAIRQPLLRFHPEAKKPGALIHRRCTQLIRGLKGGWHYKRVQVSGVERYHDIPEKNEFSHPCDAFGYWMLGRGEIQRMSSVPKNQRPQSVRIAKCDFDVMVD